MSIVMRDPKKLKMHPLRKHFPEIDTESADWRALSNSVHGGGVLQPILITAEDGYVVDGAWRRQAADNWGFKEIPCQVVADKDAGWIIAESLICRKQMTRGATIYLMVPIVKAIVESGEKRRLANLINQRTTNEIELKPQHFSMSSNLTLDNKESVRSLCVRWGITYETFYKAKAVWLWLNEGDFTALKKLHTDLSLAVPAVAELRQLQEDLREDFEHQLLIGEKNLWNVESGIKGRLTGGAHEPPQQQLELFGDALDSLATRAARFATPDKAAPEIRKWIAATESEMNLKGLSDEEVIAKMEAVAATCDVTRKTIQEWLKQRATAAK